LRWRDRVFLVPLDVALFMTAPKADLPLLEVRNLRTWFTSEGRVVRAVDGVSFHLDPGEALGIVGESGCGKTVTSLSIMGLVPQPAGRIMPGSSIRFRGAELTELSTRRLRRLRGTEIAMIFQEPMTSLNPVYTVGSQLLEAVRRSGGVGQSRRQATRKGVELLQEVGIGDPERRFHQFPHQLSGGLRQRVMIAMALAGEPSLLIADEPTSALDVTVQAQILELLHDLRRSRGMSLLLISHDLEVVGEVCDRVVVLYAGEAMEVGSLPQVFRQPAHPYTRGLVGALPRGRGRLGGLEPIPGSVPKPIGPRSGCPFSPRCPDAEARCWVQLPPLFIVNDERWSRCWLEAE